MVTRLSSVRSNLPIFACWVVNNVDCTWADFCRGTGRSLCWTCDSSGRVSGLVHAQGSTSSSPEPGGPGEATSSAPSMTAEGGGHLCVALQLLLASRLVYLFQPRAGTDVRTATLERGSTVQAYSIMNECVGVHANQQISSSHTLGSRGHQMEGAGARMSQTGGGTCSDNRQ